VRAPRFEAADQPPGATSGRRACSASCSKEAEHQGDPQADKKALAAKLITNRRVREGAVELLKDSSVRAMLLLQAAQRFRRP
jgi:hypothetical protein